MTHLIRLTWMASFAVLAIGLVPGCDSQPPRRGGEPTTECTPADCLDDDLCTIEECVDTDGSGVEECVNTPIACEDGLVCDPETGNCAGGAGAACDTDDDCTTGAVCEGGECVERPAVACEDVEDCDDGEFCNGLEVCVENLCEAGPSPCSPGQRCDEDGDVCVEATAVELANPEVDFANLIAGASTELVAPQPAVPLQEDDTVCVCAWSADGDGTFTPNPGCGTTYTPRATDTVISVEVVCFRNEIVYASEEYDQPVTVWVAGDCATSADCNDFDLCTLDACNNETGECMYQPIACPAEQGCDPGTGDCELRCPAGALAGSSWRLVSVGDLGADPVEVPPDYFLTLKFKADDDVWTGDVDCNGCGGTYESSEGCAISISDAICTEAGCSDTKPYTDLLEAAGRYNVTEDALLLYSVAWESGVWRVLTYEVLGLSLCETDSDCDDGLFCTGVETCGADGLCDAGTDPCEPDTEDCDEEADTCVRISINGHFELTLGPDTFTGGASDDPFYASLVFNTPTGTNLPSLQNFDILDGGAGNDELNAEFNFTAGATTVQPTIWDIEEFYITDFGTAATTLSFANITGCNAVNSTNGTNANALVLDNVPDPLDLGITGTNAGMTVNYSTNATSAADDSMTLSLNNVAAGTVTINSTGVNGLESVSIDSAGAPNTLSTLVQGTGTSMTTLTCTGDQDLAITGALPAFTTINCAGATGAFTMGTNVASAGNVTIIGGAGSDVLYGSPSTGDSITGNDGNDRINVLGAGTGTGAANQADAVSGGSGNDIFAFQASTLVNLCATSAGTTSITRITDFNVATDKISLVNDAAAHTSITLQTPQTIGTAANLTAVYAGITAIAVSVNAGAANGVVVTVSAGAAAGTYLYINDATVAVSNAADMLVNITGINGTLAVSNFQFN
ncbi:MAG: META domain-containing protein [bacterium]|nr:META domain-containing protein [bacterium]